MTVVGVLEKIRSRFGVRAIATALSSFEGL